MFNLILLIVLAYFLATVLAYFFFSVLICCEYGKPSILFYLQDPLVCCNTLVSLLLLSVFSSLGYSCSLLCLCLQGMFSRSLVSVDLVVLWCWSKHRKLCMRIPFGAWVFEGYHHLISFIACHDRSHGSKTQLELILSSHASLLNLVLLAIDLGIRWCKGRSNLRVTEYLERRCCWWLSVKSLQWYLLWKSKEMSGWRKNKFCCHLLSMWLLTDSWLGQLEIVCRFCLLQRTSVGHSWAHFHRLLICNAYSSLLRDRVLTCCHFIRGTFLVYARLLKDKSIQCLSFQFSLITHLSLICSGCWWYSFIHWQKSKINHYTEPELCFWQSHIRTWEWTP